MGDVFVFALTAALNPTLLAATTVMLLLEHPKRMLLGYLLGALMTSITLGLLIVFTLEGSNSTTSTTQHTLSPIADLVLGGLLLVVAFVFGTGYRERRKQRRSAKKPKKDKGPPRWQRTLNKGSARVAFLIGALLTLPGGSYLAGLHRISEQSWSDSQTVIAVVVFNLIMLMLLEIPLIGYTVAPDWTPQAVDRFKAWLVRVGPRAALVGAGTIGSLLVIKGVAGLLA